MQQEQKKNIAIVEMGRRRRRNRNRNKRQNIRCNFHANSNKQAFEFDVNRELYDHEQEKHLKNIAEQKKDLLSRSVFVGSVLGSLHDKERRDALKGLLEQKYGPVQRVAVRKGGGRHPMGLVTFNFEKDASRVFGGSLLEAAKAREQLKVACKIGYKGFISIRPATDYNATMNEDDLNSDVIEVNTKSLLLGYWFPQGKDECCNFPGLEALARNAPNTWLHERSNATKFNPIMKIDVQRAVVELDVSHCVGKNPMDSFFDLIAEVICGTRTLVSFRFKDLVHPIKLCHNRRGSHFLIFELQHPPRLTSVTINPTTGYETSTRLTTIQGLPELGSCLGYQLEIEEVEVNRLISTQAFRKLKKMGLYDDEFDVVGHAEAVHIEQLPKKKLELNTYIASFSSHRIGLLIRSVLDANSCAWFDMLDDKTSGGHDIHHLVRNGENDLAERVSHRSQLSTYYFDLFQPLSQFELDTY